MKKVNSLNDLDELLGKELIRAEKLEKIKYCNTLEASIYDTISALFKYNKPMTVSEIIGSIDNGDTGFGSGI